MTDYAESAKSSAADVDAERETSRLVGATPYWIKMPERVKELADAISRYSNTMSCSKDQISYVKMWACEIVLLCDCLNTLNESAV